MTHEALMSARSANERCDCQARGDRRISLHADTCAAFACFECGALTVIGEEHKPDCAERCPHCGSEGSDNDHRDGCPTIGTCAQCYPWIPRDQGWHYEPPAIMGTRWRDELGVLHWTYSEWLDAHMAEHHPGVVRF